jgi:hypothetical protein
MKHTLTTLWRRIAGPRRPTPRPVTDTATLSSAVIPDVLPAPADGAVEMAPSTARAAGDEAPKELRRMAGTKLYLAMSDLTPDQQEWFSAQEMRWLDRVDPLGQDFHLVYAQTEHSWQVRLGAMDGPRLEVDPTFSISKWGADGVILRRRLIHLFMDRNEIPGTVFVYRKTTGALFEKETVRAC